MRLWSFRLISVLASAALPLIYYLIASELTTNQPVRLASAVTPLAIPGITLRNGPMINTDALLILLTSLSVLFAIRIAKGDLTVRTGIALGLSTGLAILTKAHGLLVIPVIVIAYLIRAFHDRRVTPEWWRSVALSGGITLVVGGWWWIRNVLRSGAIQPVRHLEPVTEPLVFDWLAFDWAGWFGEAARRLQSSFWGGGFALPGTRYMMFYWVLTVLVIVGSAIGWAISRDRATSSVSGLFALLLIPAVLLTSALLSAERGRVVGVQGRYFFPGLAGIAPLVVLGIGSVMRRGQVAPSPRRSCVCGHDPPGDWLHVPALLEREQLRVGLPVVQCRGFVPLRGRGIERIVGGHRCSVCHPVRRGGVNRTERRGEIEDIGPGAVCIAGSDYRERTIGLSSVSGSTAA